MVSRSSSASSPPASSSPTQSSSPPASSSPKAKRARVASPGSLASSSPTQSSSPPVSAQVIEEEDELSNILFIESILNHSKPIATHASPGRVHPSPIVWLPKDQVSALYKNLDDQMQFETLFSDLCKRGFTPEDISTLTMTLGFGSDMAFMFDQTNVRGVVPRVLAACIFMRIKKEEEIYLELLCSNTRNGIKLLNALTAFAGRTNIFGDGITYKTMTLIAAGSRVKDLYKNNGFVEYNAADTYQLVKALSP